MKTLWRTGSCTRPFPRWSQWSGLWWQLRQASTCKGWSSYLRHPNPPSGFASPASQSFAAISSWRQDPWRLLRLTTGKMVQPVCLEWEPVRRTGNIVTSIVFSHPITYEAITANLKPEHEKRTCWLNSLTAFHTNCLLTSRLGSIAERTHLFICFMFLQHDVT